MSFYRISTASLGVGRTSAVTGARNVGRAAFSRGSHVLKLSSLAGNPSRAGVLQLLGNATRCKVLAPTRDARYFSSAEKKKPKKTLPSEKNFIRGGTVKGRRRFYKVAGVAPALPPWGSEDATKESVESPISAGVDGTQSASGVVHPKHKSESDLKSVLIPHFPSAAGEMTSVAPTDSQEPEWFGVTLDGRPLRTPAGQLLTIPSLPLALAISAEWDAQSSHIAPVQMPLMTLVCTALDQTVHNVAGIQQKALTFLPTDTTCYMADPLDDRVLYRRQEKYWKGVHEFVARQAGGHAPAVAMGANEALPLSRYSPLKPSSSTGGNKNVFSGGLPHPDPLYEYAGAYVKSLDVWHLTALNAIANEAKSLIVAMAAVQDFDGFSHLQKIVDTGRVEEEFQIENWGLVEGGHDYDRLNAAVGVGSARVMIDLLRHTSTAP
jgi:ATP synthase F1 complex assembly factor 2